METFFVWIETPMIETPVRGENVARIVRVRAADRAEAQRLAGDTCSGLELVRGIVLPDPEWFDEEVDEDA